MYNASIIKAIGLTIDEINKLWNLIWLKIDFIKIFLISLYKKL